MRYLFILPFIKPQIYNTITADSYFIKRCFHRLENLLDYLRMALYLAHFEVYYRWVLRFIFRKARKSNSPHSFEYFPWWDGDNDEGKSRAATFSFDWTKKDRSTLLASVLTEEEEVS
jgi:hypothetical protein